MPENEIVDEDVGLGTWLRALPGTNEVSTDEPRREIEEMGG